MFCWLVAYIIAFLLVCKLIDRLIRFPCLSDYGRRYILVTGCDSGFGNLLAKRLDRLECHVFAGCLTQNGETELRAVSSERLTVVPLDVTNRESVSKALIIVKSKLPQGKGLWGVVNNAGGMRNAAGRPDWIRLEDYKVQSDLNLWGLIDVTLTFLSLVKREKGRIVNMSSINGRITFTDTSPYCIAKHGVEAFTDALRRTLRPFQCKAIIIEPGIHFHQTLHQMENRVAQVLRLTFERADPSVQVEYGENYAQYACSGKGVRFLLSNGSSRVTDVVDAYEHALFGCHPRARYVVGWDANYVLLPIQWLPEWIGDWILEMLDRERPLPALVK